jgi:hypothetical protein
VLDEVPDLSAGSLWSSSLCADGGSSNGSSWGLRDLAVQRTDAQAASLRFEWIKYILSKNRGRVVDLTAEGGATTKTSSVRTGVEVIDLDDSASDSSSDRPQLAARRGSQDDVEHLPLSLRSLHLSVSNALTELHRVSLAEDARDSGGAEPTSHSILAAETQLTRWLNQWVVRYDKPPAADAASGGTPLKAKGRGRRFESDWDDGEDWNDGCGDSEAEADFSDYERHSRQQRGRSVRGAAAWGRPAKEELSNVFILSGKCACNASCCCWHCIGVTGGLRRAPR